VTEVLVARGLRVDVPLTRKQSLTTVDGVDLVILAGAAHAIVGRSGSGKTSLLSVLGMLDARFTGELRLGGTDVRELSDAARARLRNERIGFVFQSYSLMPQLTALQNVLLATEYGQRSRRGGARARADASRRALDQVGLSAKAAAFPRQLSGGEQQRVAIARALVNEPQLILADEPTGALDESTGEQIMTLLIDRARRAGSALVIVTHDPLIAARCERRFSMSAGRLEQVAGEVR
jgi:putative ABC transport system ATP-binding protein